MNAEGGGGEAAKVLAAGRVEGVAHVVAAVVRAVGQPPTDHLHLQSGLHLPTTSSVVAAASVPRRT